MNPDLIHQQIEAALPGPPLERFQTVARLRHQAPRETLDAVLALLDSDDPDLASRSAPEGRRWTVSVSCHR